jgi:hypothetical protein
MKFLFLSSLVLACAFSGVAQTPTPTEQGNGCQQYKMRVQQAPADHDNKMLTKESSGSQLARGRVIDPCAQANRRGGGTILVLPKQTTPPLKLPNPLMKDDTTPAQPLKPPSEMLRPKIPLIIPPRKP